MLVRFQDRETNFPLLQRAYNDLGARPASYYKFGNYRRWQSGRNLRLAIHHRQMLRLMCVALYIQSCYFLHVVMRN
jgi:hypothetical protein